MSLTPAEAFQGRGLDLGRVCAAVCTQQTYVFVVLFGLFFGCLALGLFLARKKIPLKWFRILFWGSLLIFLFFSINFEDGGCGSGCAKDGIFFEGIKFLPF